MRARRLRRPGARADTDVLRDVARLRTFLSRAGVQALFDAPWLPMYLLVITLMHPLLGVAAALGAMALALLGVVTERLTRGAAPSAIAAALARRQSPRRRR